MTVGIVKIVNEQKRTQNSKKCLFKKCLCLKTKQSTEMNDEEHSDIKFYYPEEQETAEKS